ncbi:protein kinase domain-containing protein [Mycobacterium sp. NPDC051198]
MATSDDRATRRDSPVGTERDGGRGTARDDRHETVRDGAGGAREYGIVLPDYLAADYDVVDDLSAGGEATVAVVRHRGTDRLKVVKIYRQGITLPQSLMDKVKNADARHVLPVERSVFTGWATPRFVELMDYVPDGSLAELLQESRAGVPDRARHILVQMTDALEYIHDRLQMVHRDIKPANILIRQRDPLDLVLADLGIASELDEIARSRRETAGGVKGTPVYQSPETLNSSDAGRARDWWALGMTMCEVLTGQHPFKDSAGNPLSDHGRINTAIVMGEFDLSIVTDERWNMLCRGLLTHHPDDRWGARQVRAWLAGETPAVASMRSRPAVARPSAVGSFTFAGQSFTDPEALASHMQGNWNKATELFISAPECEALRTWIREDVQDRTIATNLLTPVGGDSALADARIIAFTSHYRPGRDVSLRGNKVTSGDLALRFLKAGGGWKDDPFLKLLQPKVVDALVESRYNPAADQHGQSVEYRALAQYSRHANDVDREISSAAAAVVRAVSVSVEGSDVGVDVRESMPRRIDRAQAMARAALLSSVSLDEIRADFGRMDGNRPGWFADLCVQVGDPASAHNVDAPGSIARMVLAVAIEDLATLYEQTRTKVENVARKRRHDAEAAARAELIAEERSVRNGVAMMAGLGAVVSLVGLIAHIWVAPMFGTPDHRDWVKNTAYTLLHWPSAEMQQVVFGLCLVALTVLALMALFSTVDITALRTVAQGGWGVTALCILPMILMLIATVLVFLVAIVITIAVVALIGFAIAAAAGG